MNGNKKLYNLFLILVAVSMLFESVFGSFSVADTNTEKSEKSDDNYLLSDIPDELSDEPPFDAEAVSEKDAEDYRKWAQRDPRWGQLPMGASGKTVAQIGCLVTSVTKIIIQSGYRTSDTFNVATLVNWLNANGGLSDDGNLYWYKPAQMIDGLEFEGMEYYEGDSSSAAMQEKIMSYVRQDKHVILTVKNYGHYVAVDNAKSIAEGRVYIMDSLNNVAGNADVALDSRYPYVSRLCIYSGNNPNDSDYISRCSFEMTHLEAQVKSRATLFSLPCDASAGFGSVAVSTASAGEKLVVTGDLVNTLGQSWHQVFVNGSHLYVKQTEIGFVRFLDDIEIQSETIPQGTLPLGRSFALTQTVVSRHSITRIEGMLADIGDEQSIEQSLSTFSSHMTNIVRILNECGPNTLILFDELGAGTDPTEGAALAISIIEYAREHGSVIAATTHYAELKVYATTAKGVINASCEFDVATLRPTYRLLVGIPGKSNAFAISERLGVPAEIIADARSRVGTESASFEATIEKLESVRQALERDRDEAERKLREAEENRKESAKIKIELAMRLEKAELKARRDAERIIAEARETAEAAFAEIDEMRSRANADEDHRAANEARAELRRRLNEAEEHFAEKPAMPEEKRGPTRPAVVGDTVELLSMGVKAEVVGINKDGSLSLRAGIMNVTARQDEVRVTEKQPKKKVVSSTGTATFRQAAVAPELDLRGMETLEAIPVMERYIDSAVMGKLHTVTIIHGKGTGALRQAVQQSLRKNKAVKSFRLGRYGEGETGVTVVELK